MKKDPAATGQRGGGSMENPPAASSTGAAAKNSPWSKQIEVVGFRLTQNKAKKTEVRFLVVNHSGAEVQDLAGTVSLQARTSKADEAPIGAFSFKAPTLGPYESKQIIGLANTKWKV